MRIAFEPEITREGGQVQVQISAPTPSGSAPEYQGTVTGSIVLANAGEALTAQGWLQSEAVVQCSRCARLHTVTVRIAVSEECVLRDIDRPQAYTSGESGAVPFPILNGNEIDLSELVRQLLHLHLPLRSLCRPNCAGLCPHCGQDLNQGPCQCATDSSDPRLAPLAALRAKQERKLQ
jgi:uncharacterized protein